MPVHIGLYQYLYYLVDNQNCKDDKNRELPLGE